VLEQIVDLGRVPAPLLRIAGLSKSFGTVRAVRDVDLTVEAGQVVCIIGPSGCGKSTLLRCINFLEEPDAGYVYINGLPMGAREVNGVRKRDSEANVNRMRSKIGMVFQQFNVWPHLTALGNVVKPQVWVGERSNKEAELIARQILERVGLKDKIDAYPAELSGGQLQRVAIARALAMEPELMLFDEPTSSLDPELVSEVLDVMREIANANRTMIVVTHELGFAAQVADRALFMDEGRIVEDGPPQSVLGNPDSERLRQFMAKVLHNEHFSNIEPRSVRAERAAR
jgi:polar amino acid transport system ATP-binding protein